MFVEKTIELEAWKKVQAQSEQLAAMVAKACRKFPELPISEEVWWTQRLGSWL